MIYAAEILIYMAGTTQAPLPQPIVISIHKDPAWMEGTKQECHSDTHRK